MTEFDAAVVGAGPNGLSAAIELSRSGRKVLLVERMDDIGGGTRTEELTLPGFRHDVCSAIHPAGVASPFFNDIGLVVDWIEPPLAFTHPLDGGRVVAMRRSVGETASQFDDDADRYDSLMSPFVEEIDKVVEDVLSPMTLLPKNKAMFARSAAIGGLPASVLISRFESDAARALLAGLAAHSIAPFSAPATAAVGIMLGAIGHAYGWPMAKGGSQAIATALGALLEAQGGSIETGREVSSVEELPGSLAVLDVMPPAALRIAGDEISAAAARRLSRWEPGPGVFKVDWALSEPIPWTDELSAQTATVHVGGTYEEISAAEKAVARGEHPEEPFVLLAQQSLFDSTRAPDGQNTAWGYCHVPNGSTVDMTEAIESQVERFAPGFKDTIIDKHTLTADDYEAYNPNYVGGDIGGGNFGLKKVLQMGLKRPYALGDGIFLGSAATPPGAGVHGMCGYNAARAALNP